MKKINLLILLFTCITAGAEEWKWTNPLNVGFPVIQNQGWTEEIGNTYVRFPNRAQSTLREHVWNLSRHSAGLAIHFYSNAPEIKIRYGVTGAFNMPHMPTTGVSGIDLYAIDSNGNRNFCFGNYMFSDTVTYHYTSIGKDMHHDYGYEYRLYLPLYNGVSWMDIGVPDSCTLDFIPLTPTLPVVLYGTSIAQGACASRPGMAWSTILQRSLDYPLINLGFSGNGQLEKAVIDLITEIEARLYILDCIPNVSHLEEEEIIRRLIGSVKQIRSKHTAPVLLIEHSGTSTPKTDLAKYESVDKANQASLKAYEQLQREGIADVYYLTRQELNMPADGWVDYVHPNDLGMQAQANAIEKKVREILKIPVGNLSTTQPVTQRREPYLYEWQTRHRQILSLNKAQAPEAVIIGNSITHFWGGEPEAPLRSGEDSWNEFMRPQGFRNMGYGWDRIENVLWRVYHDELSGFETGKVVLMIGTNNMGLNSDEEIVEGLRFLLTAIKERQSKAQIKVIGILPRREHEQWVSTINTSIREMTEKEGYIFQDAGKVLLQSDGKIDESLFSDGLHPNEKGYRLIAPLITN